MVGCDLQRILADAVFRHRCRSKGLCLHSPARRLARPLASATVGAFASAGLGEFRRSGGKRQRRGLRPPPFETTPWGWAIIKSRQSRPEGGFGWQRLTPPGMGTPPAGGMGRFVLRHEYLSFFVKRKVPKKTTQTYGLRIPWRGAGKCKFGGAGFAELVRRGTLSVRGIACTSCAAAADNSEGRGWCAGRVAIIKSRPLRREAPQWVGVPVGHGYNYSLACGAAE